MKKFTSSCLFLALLISSALFFASCGKEKDEPATPEVYEEKDPKVILVRDWVTKRSGYDLTGIKPEVSIGNFEKHDGVGPFKGEDFFTLKMAQSLDTTLMRLIKVTETKPYLTLHLMSFPVIYKDGVIITDGLGSWYRNIQLIVRPAEGTETFAAQAVVTETMSDLYGKEEKLWSVKYIIPKK